MDANIPHVDLGAALNPAALAVWLEYQYAEHTTRTTDLMEAYGRFLEVTANGIGDDALVGRATDFAKQITTEAKATDETRTRIKAPVLHAQRLIDGEAKKLTDKLNSAVATITTRITMFLRAKEEAARKASEEEAARLQAEAEAKIMEAQQSGQQDQIDTAIEAIDKAQAAAAVAEATPLDLSRVRSQMGSLTGLKSNWVYDVVDLTKVPAHLLTINDAAVKLAIKQGAREIAGLKIWNDTKASIR